MICMDKMADRYKYYSSLGNDEIEAFLYFLIVLSKLRICDDSLALEVHSECRWRGLVGGYVKGFFKGGLHG